ncbi:MAG TPA: DUF6599 family protein [Terriglobales bacterium]|nr:DUF6599 family protein [Terriglobales bacterium]
MIGNIKFYVAVVIAVALLFAGTGCKNKAASAAEALPQSNQVTGWEKVGETRTYTPSNLSDYINGGAEQYIKAGVKDTVTSDYKFQNKIEAVADVYTMSDAQGAQTIFEADPAGNAKTVPLGDAARSYSQSLVFRKGPYLVRIVAYQDAPEVQQALVDLGRGIESILSK